MPPEQFWLMLAQTIATAILGAGAIAVAIVSAVIAYQNNFGWKPVAFPTWHRYSIDPIGRLQSVVFAFDIWNRRKYPIVVRHLSVTFSGTPLSAKPTMNERSANESPNDDKTSTFSHAQTVGPQTNFEFIITAPFEIADIHQLNGDSRSSSTTTTRRQTRKIRSPQRLPMALRCPHPSAKTL